LLLAAISGMNQQLEDPQPIAVSTQLLADSEASVRNMLLNLANAP
jgi:hypothetical protein